MTREINLRPYQEDGIAAVRGLYRGGVRRVLLVAPTGAGKTLIAAYMMRAARDKKTRTAFVVDRVNLVDQTSGVFDYYGIDHGVIQGGHWRDRLYEIVQVCSAQTLEKRGFLPDMGLLVVDEAHCMRKQTSEFIQNATKIKVLGLTATPFTAGMDELYDDFVNVATTNKLIADGFLVPLKMFACMKPNMKGAKTSASGEWTEEEIQRRGTAILGSIVQEWQTKTNEHFGGPVKTIVFSANVAHGAALVDEFQRAGHNFVQISHLEASDSPQRRAIIEEFRKPDSQIRGLVSCEVLTKGFDCPDVLCGIGARPYRRSFSGHIQQLGRVMRPAPGKMFGLWLDHSGNVMRFLADQEHLFEYGVQSLKPEDNPDQKKRDEDAIDEGKEKATCKACGAVMLPHETNCSSCGWERPRNVQVEQGVGVMIEIGKGRVPAVGQYEYLADKGGVFEQIAHIARIRKRGDVAAAETWARVPYKNIYGEWPPRIDFARVASRTPDPRLQGLIQSKMIAFFKSKHVR